jgi:hypothetical protein
VPTLMNSCSALWRKALLFLLAVAGGVGLQAAEFAATGPTKETKLQLNQFLGAVKVTFDLLPTTMSFDLQRRQRRLGRGVVHNLSRWHSRPAYENPHRARGYGPSETGKDLVLWLNRTIDLNVSHDHRVEISILPRRLKDKEK